MSGVSAMLRRLGSTALPASLVSGGAWLLLLRPLQDVAGCDRALATMYGYGGAAGCAALGIVAAVITWLTLRSGQVPLAMPVLSVVAALPWASWVVARTWAFAFAWSWYCRD